MATLRIIVGCLLLVLATSAAGSEVEANARGAMINVDYSLATPLGETRTTTSNGSPQGLGMQVRFRGRRVIGGLGISWQIFREDKQAPGTLTGAQYEEHTTSLIPVMASGYFVWTHGAARTFIGGGVGGMMAHHVLKARAEDNKNTTWYVAASGLAGALLELTPGFGLESKVRYVGGYKSGKKPVGMVQLTIGFTFIY